MSDLTYKEDYDDGMIEFFVDGVLLTTWTYEDDAEACFLEFKKVFDAGFKKGTDSSQLNAVEHFGSYLIDEHESKFAGGECQIQAVCVCVLERINAK